MRHILTFAAVAAFAAAPAFAQTGETRVGTQSPAGGQVGAGNQQPGQLGSRVTTGTVGAGTTGNQTIGNATAGNQATAGRAGVNDALFAAAATDGNLTELTLSQLGAQRATDPELKQFSQQMLEEHTRLGQEMQALMTQKGIRVPEMVDVRSQFCAQSLAGLTGEKFDKCYAKAQLVIHMDSVATFEAEAERGLDPDVKALAARALPRIKAHLHHIKPIAKKYMEKEESEHSASESRISAPGGERPVR